MSWVQKLPVTVPELVSSSPSLAADGSLVIGSQHTSVYLLDAKTGLLDHMFVDVASISSGLGSLPGKPCCSRLAWENTDWPCQARGCSACAGQPRAIKKVRLKTTTNGWVKSNWEPAAQHLCAPKLCYALSRCRSCRTPH